ncbi:8595_t:CDS:2 [Rhizophagus irregularis]|nr:8595_t:CDS:2 [Rhizophagus irregularis]
MKNVKWRSFVTQWSWSRICALLEEGYPSRYVVDKEKISQSTVIRIKQCKDAIGTFKDKPKSGRPKLLTGQNERKVLRYITTGKCTNAVAIKKLKFEKQMGVSESTVNRTLHRNGSGARVKQKKPYLKKTHRIAQDWSKVIWSDESKLMIYGSDSREYCWKKPGEPLRDHRVKTTVKFGLGSIMSAMPDRIVNDVIRANGDYTRW